MTLDPRLERQEVDPGRRVQLVSLGQLMHPGCCALCRTGNCDEGYVDLNIFFDYEGQIYLCMDCVNNEVIPATGGFTLDVAEVARQNVKELNALVIELRADLEKSNDRLAKYDDLFGSAISTSASVIDAAMDVTETVFDANAGSDDGSEAGEPVAAEPVKGSRRVKPQRTTGGDTPPDASGFIV